jgi:hypothetical protein
METKSKKIKFITLKSTSLFILLLIIVFSSCKTYDIKLYTHKRHALGVEIRGDNIDEFFIVDKNRELILFNIPYSKENNKEVDHIIKELNSNGFYDEVGLGIWDFAIIRGKDTLYCDRHYMTWRYNSMVSNYNSKIFNDSLVSVFYP